MAGAGQRPLPTSGFVFASHRSPGCSVGSREATLDRYRDEEGQRELAASDCFGEAGLGVSSRGSEPGSLQEPA